MTPDLLTYGGAGTVLIGLAVVLQMLLRQNNNLNAVYRAEIASQQLAMVAQREQHDREMEAMRREVRRSNRKHGRCDHRLTVLIGACLKGGMDIPAEVWANGNGNGDDEEGDHDDSRDTRARPPEPS